MKNAQRKKERNKQTNHWSKLGKKKEKKEIHTEVQASTKLNCDWVPKLTQSNPPPPKREL
jgi:hypothetical protein